MASIEWPSSTTADLLAYTERLQTAAIEAAGNAVEYLHRRTVTRAMANPEWMPLADNIEVWAQDGHLVIGVQDEAMVSQAFALEYGDEVLPPSPLFRTMSADIRAAGEEMTAEMESRYGYGGRFRVSYRP